MEFVNGSRVQEFVLLGFELGQSKRYLLLLFFGTLYVLTLAENITIITLVVLDTHLARLPMYILLSNFSWIEMCYVSATVPRMLFDLATLRGIISFHNCFIQFYVFFALGSTECFYLSAMALDRYLAICHPLRYPQIMSANSCYSLVGSCWIIGFLWYLVPAVLISRLPFCGSNIIDHFLCDAGPILSLACPPLGAAPIISQFCLNALIIGNMSFVALSYSVVVNTLMKSASPGSRMKAFSTISFHLLVVILFYGSVAGMYLIPGGENQSAITKAVTLFYTAVTPFLNPMIYCLRNNQVKEALFRLLKRKVSV
ncbi:olfactory receptor 11G2-like [Sphaerodactylus townsendi]|uniref:olfactory receptor 11G2-like n=1 Tax=Sphaerodactylus townsendi TaxID=933632 RepID=UPI0020272371|nr:olfactory receptor 11G2-like [Sphaerodactylus townsendi]XP_048339045.1 olfactory receptor 11G2-like [Sphaerodactylus townsendi]